MNTIAKLWGKFGNWILSGIIVALLIMQPQVTSESQRLTITFGPPEAYAAGTADYSLGTNGATNQALIQAALNALPTQGGLLHFKVGTYNITQNATGSLNRTIGNVTIEGEGKGTLFTGNGSWLAGGNNWTFSHLAVNQTSMLPGNCTWERVFTPEYVSGVSRDSNGHYVVSTLNGTQITATTGNISQNLTTANLTVTGNETTSNLTVSQNTSLNFLTVNGTSPFGFFDATVQVIASDAPAFLRSYAIFMKNTGNGALIAVCNGTADDLTISPFVTVNRHFMFSPGTFTFNNKIDIGGNFNIWFEGSGRGVTLVTIANNRHDNIFAISNAAYDVTFSSMTIDGNKVNENGGSAISQQSVSSNTVTLHDMEIRNVKGVGVAFAGTYNTISNSLIWECDGGGVQATHPNGGNKIVGTHFIRNGFNAGVEGAVRWIASSNNSVVGSTFRQNCQGIELTGNSTFNAASGCTFEDTNRYAIVLSHGGNDFNSFSGLTIVNSSTNVSNGFDAIYITGSYNNFSAVSINGSVSGNTNAGIREDATTYPTNFNNFVGITIGNTVSYGYQSTAGAGANSNVMAVQGWVTVNSFSFNITSGSNTATILHGLASTPTGAWFSSSSNETGWFSWTANATSINVTCAYNVTANRLVYGRFTIGAGN